MIVNQNCLVDTMVGLQMGRIYNLKFNQELQKVADVMLVADVMFDLSDSMGCRAIQVCM